MQSLISFSSLRCTFVLFTCFWLNFASAQEANILGLPAVPQVKPGVASSAGKAASASAPAPKATPSIDPSRDILAGELGLQHSAINGVGRLILTTRSSFATAGAKANAIDAARAVQRDLVNACAKQCKPLKMAVPKIIASGQLEFELVFSPLYQHLNQAQFLAALQSKPLNLTAAQLAAPAASAQAAPSAEPATSPTAK
jgi:hypothetical protein